MPSILAFRRRDPWWGQEGPAARRRRRYHRLVSVTAFLASLAAFVGAAAVWAIQLGFAAMLGFNLTITIG
jgi:hypothetical protein